MSLLQPITACLKKVEVTEEKDDSSKEENTYVGNVVSTQSGLLWRMSSQLYNIGSGAVDLGVGSVKWVASTTYTVGTGVVSATQTVVSKVVPSAVPKPKKE